MAPPRPTITPHIGVPKVSFRKIQPVGKEYDGVDEKLFHQFGYNEVSIPFERPEHYIRYIDPVESELLAQVEYDMDEQDDEWLATVNTERYKDQSERVSAETFEIIIDRLEKEWFELMKRVPKPDQALPSEDSTCAVCDDGEGENSNAIVFCDGCNLAVHQDCYGVPYIPEGQWLCRKCTVAPESRVECILCPNDGGAFKQTSNGKWAHLLCAIWVPECVLGNPTFMEPIENSDKIPKQRWKLVCSICKVKQGACIQCNKNTCVTAFHVSCARRHKLLSPMKSHGENELQAFCEKHLPTEMRVNRVVPPSPSHSAPTPASPVRSPKKSVRVQAQPAGPPLVPSIIVDKIMQYTARITFRKKLPFLLAVCRYWTLKREARRGAPLLKRLHLEPWATSTATKLQTDDDKIRYLENLNRLRNDLERVRNLADLVRQREGEKQSQAQAVESLITTCLLPFDAELRKAYDSVVALDRHNNFMKPVSRVEFPEYYNIIAKPMHWLGIYAKIEQHEYLDSQAFVDDVNLVLDNAIQFNRKDAPPHKVAVRIKNNARPVLEQFQQTVRERTALWTKQEPDGNGEQTTQELLSDRGQLDASPKAQDQQLDPMLADNEHPVNHEQAEISNDQPNPLVLQTPTQLNGEITPNPEDEVVPATPTPEPTPINEDAPNEVHDPPDPPPATDEPVHSPVGDMEPYIPLLDILQDQTGVSDDLPYILNSDPLTSFLTYEKAIPKPPPPPPPPPPRHRKHKKKQPTGDAVEPKASSRGAPGTPRHPHPQRVVLLVRDPAQTAGVGAPAEGSANVAATPAPSSSKIGKRKRQDSESWGQVVTDVSAHTSFKLFESGWVLPPGSTRTRRPTFPPVPKTSGTGSRKQSKEPKRVRMSSSIAGDAQTPTVMSSRQSSQAPHMDVETLGETALEHPHGTLPGDPTPSAPTTDSTPVVTSQALQPSASEPIEQILTDATAVQPPKPKSQHKTDSSSDLSELSDAEQRRLKPPATTVIAPIVTPVVTPIVTPIITQTPSGIHQDEQGEPVHYEAGTLVWARQPGFPWYPAVVFEPPDEAIPPKIIEAGHQARRKQKVPEKLYLVQFYDRQRSWTWLPISRLAMLGEVQAIDQKYLHPTGKQSGNKKEIQKAYELALQEMETVEESQAAIVTEPAGL